MSILIPLGTIPFMLFALFQAKFAIITPALITGAFAERIRFGPICYSWYYSFVYTPLCHMTWHVDGYFFKMGVLDFRRNCGTHERRLGRISRCYVLRKT
jgi:Amt family ammonium transporter